MTIVEAVLARLPGLLARCLRALGWLRIWLTDILAMLRLRLLLGLATLLAPVLVVVRIVPPLYGRYALAIEAGNTAQNAPALGETLAVERLERAAFRLGFPEPVARAGTFSLTYRIEDGIEWCELSYDFIHPVDFYGVAQWPLRVHHRVLRPTAKKLPSLDIDKMVE